MRKPIHYKQWVVVLDGDDHGQYTPFCRTRNEAIYKHVADYGLLGINRMRRMWKDAYRRGFRCIQVEIKEIQKVKK